MPTGGARRAGRPATPARSRAPPRLPRVGRGLAGRAGRGRAAAGRARLPRRCRLRIGSPDLFSLLAQLAALTRETQLQGRATNRLHAELGGRARRLAESASSPDAVAKKLAEARREARLELVGRAARGARSFRARPRGGPAAGSPGSAGSGRGFGQRPVLEALVEGNRLALERLDDALRRLDVHEIPALGKPFDPRVMRAVEVAAGVGGAAGDGARGVPPGLHRRWQGAPLCRGQGRRRIRRRRQENPHG